MLPLIKVLPFGFMPCAVLKEARQKLPEIPMERAIYVPQSFVRRPLDRIAISSGPAEGPNAM
ncbi:hypothetical protein OS189_14955 [Sulfitobacter sp. F26169L]|uniref:hypothetical protein n=1 Tax=Sulfitobacter sp. F26169L TaxID=2996015 RepID=UPI002260BDC7|nr:hypothetical protein [Sulfitobacter sp. F26169L]MCX7567644.1 hypothetical protein [Sulfitobacter sp. F26169L]